MSNFEKAEKFYKAGYWNELMLQALVKKGWLTQEEYKRIVEE